MEIGEDEVEWAVVSRLRDMLRASPTARYEVTQAYALFSAIILWTAQRMRTKEDGRAEDAAKRFHQRMKTGSIRTLHGR
ncbi:hypothetical protein [Dankookia sp. P2]|uniref:hypothetical protein n=1 Tax=Dankookia sp. P2 TaxID=3423955 RepID=UPI003D669D81